VKNATTKATRFTDNDFYRFLQSLIFFLVVVVVVSFFPKTMPQESSRLTEAQWDALLSAYTRAEVANPKIIRKKFVETWCFNNNVVQPHGSSVTRRLKHRAQKEQNKDRSLKFFKGCGHLIDCELLAMVRAKYGDSYKHQGYDERLCINCNTKIFLHKRDRAADIYIEQHMNNTKGFVIDWPDAVCVTKGSILSSVQLPAKLMVCPHFVEFMAQPIRVRKIDVPYNKPTETFCSQITGGKHPHHFRYNLDQVAQNPSDGSIGLLIFGGEDFAMVDTSGISNETIYQLSANESQSITEKETGKRQGTAGGSFHLSDNLDHDVQSLSPATKYSRVLIPTRTGSQSTKLDVMYINYGSSTGSPEVCNYQSVYNDVLMRRVSWQEKQKNAMSCPYLREKYIAEMKSRLRAYFVMDHFGLSNKQCAHWPTFLDAVTRTAAGADKSWRKAVPSLSFFECVLLEWCCWTGEMRNHQALVAHTDANKSHPLETMQAYGRLNPSHGHLGKTKQVSLFRDAVLCVLWQMIALRVKCGRDVWHLSFGNTFHVPDRSRDHSNFTWVHGP
jgi:hypothetical protein